MSNTANCGRNKALAKGNLLPSRVTTELPLLSDPVAGKVKTAPSGNACFIGARLMRISHGSSPSNKAAAAINFAPSTTEPPPTASR